MYKQNEKVDRSKGVCQSVTLMYVISGETTREENRRWNHEQKTAGETTSKKTAGETTSKKTTGETTREENRRQNHEQENRRRDHEQEKNAGETTSKKTAGATTSEKTAGETTSKKTAGETTSVKTAGKTTSKKVITGRTTRIDCRVSDQANKELKKPNADILAGIPFGVVILTSSARCGPSFLVGRRIRIHVKSLVYIHTLLDRTFLIKTRYPTDVLLNTEEENGAQNTHIYDIFCGSYHRERKSCPWILFLINK